MTSIDGLYRFRRMTPAYAKSDAFSSVDLIRRSDMSNCRGWKTTGDIDRISSWLSRVVAGGSSHCHQPKMETSGQSR
jgi:hypothetical protein